jgi:ATP-binding cassette subfamily B protein
VTTFGLAVRHGGRWLPLIGLSAVTGTAADLALPAVLGSGIDALVGGAGYGSWLVWAAGLVALSAACELIDVYAGPACVAGTTAWLRQRLVRHVLAIGPRRAARFDTGDLVARVASNVADTAAAGPSVLLVGAAVVAPLGGLALLFTIDPWLAGAFLGGVALVALVLLGFTRRTSQALDRYLQTQGRLAARLAESLAGARTIAAAGTVAQEERRVLQPLPELSAQGRLTWRVLARAAAQTTIVGPLVLVAVLGVGGLALVRGRISAGELFAAGEYAALGMGLGNMTGLLNRLARARTGARRVGEVLAVPPPGFGTQVLPDGSGRLEFRGVTVRDGNTPILAGVDLDLPGGSAVAVVGRSGAGKSVLAALAARLYDPDEGQVLLDGVPLPALRHSVLRTAIGCAFARPALVGATVADAVGFGFGFGFGFGRDRLRRAARATCADDFVGKLPRGYDTPLTEVPMSGGEAQRLGLARAWHGDRLLVLDDAMSSLDMVTEMKISRAILNGRPDRARLIVTHRATTAARADLVIWLDAGRIRAVGVHVDLWRDPAYREVFQ